MSEDKMTNLEYRLSKIEEKIEKSTINKKMLKWNVIKYSMFGFLIIMQSILMFIAIQDSDLFSYVASIITSILIWFTAYGVGKVDEERGY